MSDLFFKLKPPTLFSEKFNQVGKKCKRLLSHNRNNVLFIDDEEVETSIKVGYTILAVLYMW